MSRWGAREPAGVRAFSLAAEQETPAIVVAMDIAPEGFLVSTLSDDDRRHKVCKLPCDAKTQPHVYILAVHVNLNPPPELIEYISTNNRSRREDVNACTQIILVNTNGALVALDFDYLFVGSKISSSTANQHGDGCSRDCSTKMFECPR